MLYLTSKFAFEGFTLYICIVFKTNKKSFKNYSYESKTYFKNRGYITSHYHCINRYFCKLLIFNHLTMKTKLTQWLYRHFSSNLVDCFFYSILGLFILIQALRWAGIINII
jgi:hypothetical protein